MNGEHRLDYAKAPTDPTFARTRNTNGHFEVPKSKFILLCPLRRYHSKVIQVRLGLLLLLGLFGRRWRFLLLFLFLPFQLLLLLPLLQLPLHGLHLRLLVDRRRLLGFGGNFKRFLLHFLNLWWRGPGLGGLFGLGDVDDVAEELPLLPLLLDSLK